MNKSHILKLAVLVILIGSIVTIMIVGGAPTESRSKCPVCKHVMYEKDQINETFITVEAPTYLDKYSHTMLQVIACDDCGIIYVARWKDGN